MGKKNKNDKTTSNAGNFRKHRFVVPIIDLIVMSPQKNRFRGFCNVQESRTAIRISEWQHLELASFRKCLILRILRKSSC